MIRHNSLFKFKECTSNELIGEIVRRFRELANTAPSIREMVVGENIGDSPDNFDISSCIHFDSLDGYREYVQNPSHMQFVRDYLLPNLQSRVAAQIELDSASSSDRSKARAEHT